MAQHGGEHGGGQRRDHRRQARGERARDAAQPEQVEGERAQEVEGDLEYTATYVGRVYSQVCEQVDLCTTTFVCGSTCLPIV